VLQAVILAHGERPSRRFIEHLRRSASLFLAADGAANYLAELGIAPDVVLGDFDSLHPDTKRVFSNSRFVFNADQETCDLEKGVVYALDQGATQIALIGAQGGRIDHSLTTISILLKFASQAQIAILDENAVTYCVQEELEIEGKAGETLSLIAFTPVEDVYLEGVQWPLHGENLYPGSRGVSNVILNPPVRVRARNGVLLLSHLRHFSSEE
jgi:thiamine pyrophosphokinase